MAGRHVGVIALGNALGNSVVGAQINAEKRKQQLDAFDKHLTEVNNQQAQNLTNSAVNDIALSVGQSAGQQALAGLPVNEFEKVTSFANSSDGLDLVGSYFANDLRNHNGMNGTINAGSAAGDAIRQRNAGLQSFIDQRYAIGDKQAGMEFAALNNGLGLDVRNSQDWDAAIAFENAAWADGRRRAETVQQAKDVFNQAYETGEVTIALGGTVGGEAGAGVDGAMGRFLSLNFNSGDVVFGDYWSYEFAANLGIPMPQIHGGGELSVYPTSNFQDALTGPFSIYGGEFDAKVASVSAGFVKTNDGELTGFQASVLASTPNFAKPLHLHAGFVRAGEGGASPVYEFNYKNWWK